MEVKVNAQNWAELDFLINNFYEIVEYKRGRGIYGDRVILRRSKKPECVFGEKDKYYEFYYLNAYAVKELPRTIYEKIKLVERFVTSAEDMNLLCDFGEDGVQSPVDWAMETTHIFNNINASLNFDELNTVLIDRYKLLGKNFIDKLNEHRKTQYFLAEQMNLVTKEHTEQQLNRLIVNNELSK